MKDCRRILLTGFMLLSLEATAATFSMPSRGAGMPSLCGDDALITTAAAEERNSWAFRCGHLDRSVWQPIFTAAPGKRSYPLLLTRQPSPSIYRPDYGSCLIPADVSFYEVCENGTVLFDGNTKLYGAGQTWDTSASNVIAADNGRFIRVLLNNVEHWGAAAYVFRTDYSYVDLSAYSQLHVQIKNSGYGASLEIQLFLVDMDGHAESVRLPVSISRSYQDVVIDLEQLNLNGFPLDRTQAMVIGISEPHQQSYSLDIAKISAD